MKILPAIPLCLSVLLPVWNTGASAQIYTDPTEIPTGRLTDFAPVFTALDAPLVSVEISSLQQFMEIKGHPSSYRLSVTGSPKAFQSKSGRFVLHGDAYEKNHGFQRNAYFGIGAASVLHPARGHRIYADLHYEFAYKWYNLRNVISENPAYADVAEKSYRHIPTVCLGYAYHGSLWKAGLTLTGNAVLPDGGTEKRRFSIGGTAYCELSFGKDWKRKLYLGDARVYLNETWCSMQGTGHTVTTGFETRIARLHLGAFYRHAVGLEYLGGSAGIDLGRGLTLLYSVTFPFCPGGATAGIAAHLFALRFTMPQNGSTKRINITSGDDKNYL